MPSTTGPADLLADLSAALTTLGTPWYVFGAQAALVWGRPRLTTDLDVTVKLVEGIDSTDLVRALGRHGFTLRVEATPEFVRQTRVLPMQHERSGLGLDLVLAGPGLEDVFLDRAARVDVAGVTVPFISPEDLIVTKVLAGRSKDIEDIRGVLAERLDQLLIDQIRKTLAMIEGALGQSDLRPLFEAELARARASHR